MFFPVDWIGHTEHVIAIGILEELFKGTEFQVPEDRELGQGRLQLVTEVFHESVELG
jgi:hypothetical protein